MHVSLNGDNQSSYRESIVVKIDFNIDDIKSIELDLQQSQ